MKIRIKMEMIKTKINYLKNIQNYLINPKLFFCKSWKTLLRFEYCH